MTGPPKRTKNLDVVSLIKTNVLDGSLTWSGTSAIFKTKNPEHAKGFSLTARRLKGVDQIRSLDLLKNFGSGHDTANVKSWEPGDDKPPKNPKPGIYTPDEYLAIVTDENGKLDQDKEDALYRKHGEDVSINGPPGIADQMKQAFKNGWLYKGKFMGAAKWVRG